MPILERDPWRVQYFDKVLCPEDVFIPTDDADCWTLFPNHRWVYDKLRVAETQGLCCGPHGLMPPTYPVFSKPMINLKGMGFGSLAIHCQVEMERHYQPGHMWMPLLVGEHISTDCAVVDGTVCWLRHALGLSGTGGMFRHWIIAASPQAEIEKDLRTWVGTYMRGYTGMMNFETIGKKIIEAHLRFADQWCDLYGSGWVEALIGLYANKRWNFDEGERRDGFSIPLFAHHGFQFRYPPAATQAAVRSMAQVSSLQITFDAAREAADHPMPPGGFRLAVINATGLEAGLAAREILAKCYPMEQLILRN